MKRARYEHLAEAIKRWKVDIEKGEIYTRKGLNNRINMDGYSVIGSRIDGKYVQFGVHEVIAFAGGLDLLGEDKEVNHINGIKTDNRIENLEITTRRENIIHSFKTGLNSGRKLESHNSAKLTNEDVLEIRKQLENGVKGKDLAEKYGVNKTTISHIKTRRNWSEL